MKRPKTVDEYIKNAPKEVQEKLRELRTLIKSAAPDALEKISYGMPYYGYKGRLAYFAYARNHIGLYLMPWVLDDFKEEIKDLRTGRSTLRFEFTEKLPKTLIKKLVKAGVEKNEAKKK